MATAAENLEMVGKENDAFDDTDENQATTNAVNYGAFTINVDIEDISSVKQTPVTDIYSGCERNNSNNVEPSDISGGREGNPSGIGNLRLQGGELQNPVAGDYCSSGSEASETKGAADTGSGQKGGICMTSLDHVIQEQEEEGQEEETERRMGKIVLRYASMRQINNILNTKMNKKMDVSIERVNKTLELSSR